jgi:YgiT-type zinc finger domain-containing protein
MGRQLQQEEEPMTCIHCKGKLRKGKAPFHVDRKGYHLLFDSVPAWICTQCGEPLFEESALDAIQRAIRSLDKQTDKLAIPA